jgi:mono/diheme cytochrome c family protein
MKLGSVCGLALLLACAKAQAQQFSAEQIKSGAALYVTYCVTCHGWQMEHPGGSFDLRAFPPGQFARFANDVLKGKNTMPPWGDVLGPAEVEALWAYVLAGERKQ